jgi:hypothetical protein
VEVPEEMGSIHTERMSRKTAIRKDLQLKYSDEHTFDELPAPRLYGIDEENLLSRVKE